MMEQEPQHHLRQAIELAQQAAREMKRAASLAEHAAQLWQHALALTETEHVAHPPTTAQMSVAASKRKKQPHVRPEMTKRIEGSIFRAHEQSCPQPGAGEATPASSEETIWEDGDDWWKPRQSSSE